MVFKTFNVDNLADAQIAELIAIMQDIGPTSNKIRKKLSRFLRSTIFAKSNDFFRSPKEKKDEYEEIWMSKNLEKDFSTGLPYKSHATRIIVDGRIKMATRWSLNAIIIIIIASKIRELKSQSVIEAGSGNGINLIALAAIFPDVDFLGLELTHAGVVASISAARDINVVRNLVGFVYGNQMAEKITFPLNNIHFKQCDLSKQIKHEKNDLIYTSLALEQMDQVFDKVFPHINGMIERHCLFFEPFLEFNTYETKKVLKSKGYLYRNFGKEMHKLNHSGDIFLLPKNINKVKFNFGVCEIVKK